MDPTLCRDNLSRLLAEELGLLARLEEALQHEHGLLVANDIAGLEQATEARQGWIGALVWIEEERRALCRMHGHEPDAQGVRRLLDWCDPEGTLRGQWARCAEDAGRCRELNDRNGALVTARMKRVEGLLGILTGESERGATYGPRGGAYGGGAQRSGRVLAVEA